MKHQIGEKTYCILHILLGLFIHWCFLALFFTTYLSPFTMERVTYDHALWVLRLLVSVITGGGLILTCSHFRFTWILLTDVLSPYGIYFLMMDFTHVTQSYFKCFIAIILAFHLIVHFLKMILSPIGHKERPLYVIGQRLVHCLCYSHIIAGSVLCLFTIETVSIYAIVMSQKMDLVRNQAAEYNLSHPCNYASQLRPITTWDRLNLSEKNEMLQTVAEIESDYLGLEFIPTVDIQPMEPYTNGYYQNIKNTIVINEMRIENESPRAILTTLLHEMRHCYQHDMCQLYIDAAPEKRNLLAIRQAGQFLIEFENYTKAVSEETFEIYQNQACEIDARQYADERIRSYSFLWK